ncbi:hypothetical protein AGMMS49521_1180 [Campylobacterota bacterium]|nr:hypothetical protein AGMMS49521_1180 [Campylobacterota bacterium]
MKTFTLTIDGHKVKAHLGETILQAARSADIYIPTLCFLEKISAAGSCRLCIVEVEGTDGFVLSCQTPARAGLVVRTVSEALNDTRREIVRMMCVNHPLECGVCDKSGDCELQNKAHEFRIISQRFSAKEQERRVEDWQFLTYDPSLCVLCERCVRTCNEQIGANALSVVAGGYGSRISFNEAACSRSGECAAVCPTGAIVTKSFKYRANAWELTKTPSTCLECSGGCPLIYETKLGKPVRVSCDLERETLCAFGRFGSLLAEPLSANEVSSLSGVKSIQLSGSETNEEAFLLSKLAKKHGFSLIHNRIADFQRFLRRYASVCGEPFGSTTVSELANSGAIVLLTPSIFDDAPSVFSAVSRASLRFGAEVVLLAPFEDARLKRTLTQTIRFEAGAEEGVVALLLKTLLSGTKGKLGSYLEALDDGNLSAESSVGEEELALLKARIGNQATIVIGSEIYSHPQSENIAVMIALMRRAGFHTLLIPPTANALGIALLCDAQNGVGEESLPRVAPHAKEGTIVTADGVVKKLHAATRHEGVTIGSLATALGEPIKWAIDLTPKLPAELGFNGLEFDKITEAGYALAAPNQKAAVELPNEIAPIGEYNGAIVYFLFSRSPFYDEGTLIGSAQFAAANRLKDGDRVAIEAKEGVISRRFRVDQTMKGTIARLEVFDLAEVVKAAIRYRYEVVKLRREESNG